MSDTAGESAPPAAEEEESRNWRTNLNILFGVQLVGQFCLALSFPFLPVYINSDLSVTNPSRLAYWTGVAAAVFGIGAGLAGPVWGLVADRFGRRKMVVRAFVGGGLTIALVAATHTPLQFVLARLLCGLVAGTVPAVNALIVSETPRARLTSALARVSAAAAVGASLGPMSGGFLAAHFSLGAVFVGSGLAMTVCALPVAFWARETAGVRLEGRLSPVALRQMPVDRSSVLFGLIAANGLVSFAFISAQQLMVVRLLVVAHQRATILAGIAFAAAGVLTALGSAFAPRLTRRTGYRLVTTAAAVLLGLAACCQATGLVQGLLAGMAAAGLAFGILQPTLFTLLGFEAPPLLRATVFGVAAGVSAIGISAGPFLTGMLASFAGIGAGQLLAGAAAATAAALVLSAVREPEAPERRRLSDG